MTADTTMNIDAAIRRIDSRLEILMPKGSRDHELLNEAVRDSVLAPGKRLRPLMTVLVAEDLGGDLASAVDAGCAVEMVHAASLILDDLPCMDNADWRRGRPAIHRGYGEDVAVLASIAILSGAYAVIAGIEPLSAEARLECVRLLASAVGVDGLVAGQFQDLRGGRSERGLTEIAGANGLKTGSLFVAAVGMGAVVATADPATRRTLDLFAAELGQAFQLLDDLLDKSDDARQIGKDVGKDDGKSTIVSLIGRTPVERRIERHVENAHMHLTQVFGPASRMGRLVDRIFGRPAKAADLFEAQTLVEQEAGAR